ncbi:hypothetical protein [Absidia glauca]|uniref:SWIM-type domain-containing protein n=1 Tax=Absidia glauca TaxID=4829 RepID=A0A163LP49_ABSGL|nr:hypothetical protein [Absidia glauca]
MADMNPVTTPINGTSHCSGCAELLHPELEVHLSLDYRGLTDEEAMKLLLDDIEGWHGNRYYLIHIGKLSLAWSANFEAVCCQDTIDIDDAIPVAPIPTEVKRFIASQIKPRRLTSPGLYEAVVERFGYVVNYGQVQNLWKASFVALLRTSAACEELLYRSAEEVKYLGFTTGLFDLFVHGDQVNEYHVDSTYKTNRAGFELFGIVANVQGSGYPISNMIMNVDSRTNPANQDTHRVAVLKLFFRAMKDRGLNPTFMFCDKDMVRINAIEATWNPSVIRLCFWHLKRAVKTKLGQPKSDPMYNPFQAQHEFPFIRTDFAPVVNAPIRETGLLTTVEQREHILELMGSHYNRHALIPNGETYSSNIAIHQDSTSQMYEYCLEHNLRHARAYLYRNWYTCIHYKRWAESGVDSMIPIGKTTVLIEAHWKVMKRTHLYHYNCACLDLLTYVVLEHYYRKLKMKYQSTVVHRQKTTLFEKTFIAQWHQADRAEVFGISYATNLNLWVCGCVAFLQSPLALCKHLVKAYQASNQLQVVARVVFIQRSQTPPFVRILHTIHHNPYHPGSNHKKSFGLVLLNVVPGESTPSTTMKKSWPARQEQPVAPPAPAPTPMASDEDVPVVVMERTLLATEIRYWDKMTNVARLREEAEEDEIQQEYANMLNSRQAAVFGRAVQNGEVQFVDASIAVELRQRELGRTTTNLQR